MTGTHEHWWQQRWFAALLVLLTLVPLVYPPIPPLVDLPGHLGRYAVQLDARRTPALVEFYDFRWALIGNLGVDLLIVPLAPLLGLELATKLIVMAIPALTVAGLLWICREVNREVQPFALFALPLAYGHPFQFGFVNFALAMAMALLAFALWLRLARLGRLKLRAALFVVIGPALWVCHTYGWGMLGVLAFSAELIRQHDRRGKSGPVSWIAAAFWSGVHCLSLAPPILLMVAWRSGAHVGGQTGDWFDWQAKWWWLGETLRDRWKTFDVLSLGVIVLVIVFGLRDPRVELSRNLAASALFLLLVFIMLPRIVFGSAYADMRLTPYLFAVAVIAIRLKPGFPVRLASGIAAAGLAFVLIRLAGTTASFAIAASHYAHTLPALDRVPRGSRIVSFVGQHCDFSWSTSRMEHLPALAIVRRQAFSNDQWQMQGAQLMRVRMRAAGWFGHDPSQLVTQGACPRDKWKSLNWSLTHLPRRQFDYVWLLAPPPYDPARVRGMTPVWRSPTSVLYRIDR